MKFKLLIFTLFISLSVSAQNYVISGFVKDSGTGELLLGATVYDGNTYKGTQTNEYGFFSLSLPAGKTKLVVGYVSYESFVKDFDLQSDTELDIQLMSDNKIQEVVINESKMGNKVESSKISVEVLDVKKVKQLPVLLGETDVLKTLQLLPGVSGGTEGASGIYVRGGSPDQNLILLDGVPVYNANHLFGFFSVFSGDAIQSVSLYKGGFPARFGGRLSSVIDIRMKEGNRNNFRAEGSVGLISSKLMMEGPLFTKKTSFMVSARRTYLDILARPLVRIAAEGENIKAGYYFYDLNAKINHEFSSKNKLYFSIYNGLDEFYTEYSYDSFYDTDYTESLDMSLGWGNITAALRWNYLFSNKLFINTTATFTNYKFDVGVESIYDSQDSYMLYSLKYLSGIEDLGFKMDFDYFPNTHHSIKFGLGETYHTFKPGVRALRSDVNMESYAEDLEQTVGNKYVYGNEIDLYAEDDFEVNTQLKINGGLHLSSFYTKGKLYPSIQPRITARYKVNSDLAFKAAYSKMDQYIMLLTNTTIGLPTDLWMPVTERIPPQSSHQVALGMVKNLNSNYTFTFESFYKTTKNVIRYKPGTSFFNMQEGVSWEDQINVGNGEVYGSEFLLQKEYGKFTGWLGYTLSWNYRQFDDVNNGEKFPYKYDRRHDISLAFTYKMNENIDFGLVWVYNTGNAVTLATQKYSALQDKDDYGYTQNSVEYYSAVNDYRMPAYHRLDFSFNFKKHKRWGTAVWGLGAYNAYNRKNPFFIYQELYSARPKFYQVSLFPLIPSVSYSFIIE